MNNFGIPESRLFMLKVDYNCTYKIKNFKYKIFRLLKNDPQNFCNANIPKINQSFLQYQPNDTAINDF